MSSAGAAGAASLVGLVVANSFQISRRIGGGNWGEVYLGIGPNNQKVCRNENEFTELNFISILINFNIIFRLLSKLKVKNRNARS